MTLIALLLACPQPDAHCMLLCEEKAADCVRLDLGLELEDPIPPSADQPPATRDKCWCVLHTCERDNCGDAGALPPECSTGAM